VCRLWRDIAQRVFHSQRCVFSLGSLPSFSLHDEHALAACAPWITLLDVTRAAGTPLTTASLRHFTALRSRGPSSLLNDSNAQLLLSQLTALCSLDVSCCHAMCDDAISSLTALTHLDAVWCTRLTDAVLEPLTALQHLCADWCEQLRGRTLSCLTALRHLSIDGNNLLDDDSVNSLSALSALHSLRIEGSPGLSPLAVRSLTSLTSLSVFNWPLANVCALFDWRGDSQRLLHPLPHLERLHFECHADEWDAFEGDPAELDAALACTGVDVTYNVWVDDADDAVA
jgi:hypothetical protein